MAEKLAKPRAPLRDLKRANVFRKALLAEAALLAAAAPMEKIEKLKRVQEGGRTWARAPYRAPARRRSAPARLRQGAAPEIFNFRARTRNILR